MMDDGVEICYRIFEMLRGFGAWKMVKNNTFFKAEIAIFYEVLSLNQIIHILIKKSVS